ncbi:MAG TPA: VWA domain-containing protein [Bryobacteraceae bacterium]|jgi:Ca-activated chloride channel family protein
MILLLPALTGMLVLAQSSVAPIHVDVRLMTTSFTVRDGAGKLVDGLTKNDFELFDDGIKQTIAHFSRGEDLPLTLGLIVDFSGSQDKFVKKHRHDLESFLHAVLKPRDQAFLVCFGNHIRLGSDLTHSQTDLADGLDRCDHLKKGQVIPELGPRERRDLGTAFYDAIFYSITEKLADAEGGRKALIVFSDGEDNSSANDMMTTIETAQKVDAVLFAMRYTEVSHGVLNGRNKYGIKVMERIGRETGGADFDAGEKGMKDFFHQIEEDLRASYQIGYYPAAGPLGGDDGTFHKIKIRAVNPELKVRAKTGYFSR